MLIIIYTSHNRNYCSKVIGKKFPLASVCFFFNVKTYIYSPTCALVFGSDFFK